MRLRIAFLVVKNFPEASSCDGKFACLRVGRTHHPITSRLTPLTSLPPRRCIENSSSIRVQTKSSTRHNWMSPAVSLFTRD